MRIYLQIIFGYWVFSGPVLSCSPPEATKLSVPSNWSAHCQLLGMPYTLLAPVIADANTPQRWTLSLTFTGLPGSIIDLSKESQIWKEYQQGRNQWLARKGAQLIAFSPFQLSPLQMGVSYRWQGESYQEESFFFRCLDKLFHLKILGPIGRVFEQQHQQAQQIARSFQCSNGSSPQ